MQRPKVKQIDVTRSVPGMVMGLNDETKFIVRIGIATPTGDYDAAFATIYGPRPPKYGEVRNVEPVYEPCTFVEARISGLQRAIAEQQASFSEEKMFGALLNAAEAKAVEIVQKWPTEFPRNDYVSLTAQDISV